MDYYCEVCDKFFKPKNKYKHFESNSQNEFDKSKHIELTIENPDINNVDEVFYAYLIQHNKEYDYYLIKCHFKLVFNDNQHSEFVKSNFFDNKTMISWQNFLEEVIDNFKNKGYNFKYIEEMKIITIINKMDMSYDFYIKHNMHAPDWKLNAMNNKNEILINKFICNWRHPSNRKFESYRV